MSKLRLTLIPILISLTLSFPVLSQPPAGRCDRQFRPRINDTIEDCVPVPRTPPRNFNMLEYMVPAQKWDDADQYHLEGYMTCAPVPWGDVCTDPQVELAYARSGYGKVYVGLPDEKGNTRFSASKGRTGLLGHPCEYYATREDVGDDGLPITRLYILAETMNWTDNLRYRAYHLPNGEPTFEIGRSKVYNGEFFLQDPKFGIFYYCGAKPPEEYSLPIPGATTVYFYTMEDGNIDELNAKLGNFGPLEPKWLDIAKALGYKRAELMLLVGNWGYTGAAPGPEPWRWYYQELYYYLKGVGWVSWRWQQHIGNDVNAPFQTIKMGNSDTVVREGKDAIRNMELCEDIPR